MEQAGADRFSQSLVRTGRRCQPAAGGIGPATEIELHYASQGAAAAFRVVLLARGCRAAVLPALSHQLLARVFRAAGHAGSDRAPRICQSVLAQTQAPLVSVGSPEGCVEASSARADAVVIISIPI